MTEAGDYTRKYTIIREMILPNLPPIYTPEPPEQKSKVAYRGAVLTEYVNLDNLVRNVVSNLYFMAFALVIRPKDNWMKTSFMWNIFSASFVNIENIVICHFVFIFLMLIILPTEW